MGMRVVSTWIKWIEQKADLPSRAEVKSDWSCSSSVLECIYSDDSLKTN